MRSNDNTAITISKIWRSFRRTKPSLVIVMSWTYNNTGDKSGAEAPSPSGFPISFKEFTNVFISEFIK